MTALRLIVKKKASESIDWYNGESDTSEDVPSTLTEENSLFQDVDKLPEELTIEHFKECLIYQLTLQQTEHKTLLLIVRVRMSFCLFFRRGSKRKTFHEGAKDIKIRYDEVWRLAPRRELMRVHNLENIHLGQTLRFESDIGEHVTITVAKITSRKITGVIVFGAKRGQSESFNREELVN